VGLDIQAMQALSHFLEGSELLGGLPAGFAENRNNLDQTSDGKIFAKSQIRSSGQGRISVQQR
jgi:hypothetical protein